MSQRATAVLCLLAAPVLAAARPSPAKLTGAERAGGFGMAVALSGDTAVVGAPAERVGRHERQGAVYVFARQGGRWRRVARLTAPDGAAGDALGTSVAVSGDAIAAGAPGDPEGAARPGAVYVFTRPPAGWSDRAPSAKLTSACAACTGLGASVALSGGTVAAAGRSPAVSVFVAPPRGWAGATETARLTLPDAAAAVAMSETTIAATACLKIRDCAAYVFERPATGWAGARPAARLAPSGAPLSGPLAISGDVVVGAYAGRGESGAGAALYVFAKPAAGWADARETAKLPRAAADSPGGDGFGESVAISGDTVAAGAPNSGLDSRWDAGAVYLFTRPRGGWASARRETARLTSPHPARFAGFGESVALSADALLAGEPGSDAHGPAAAYVLAAPLRGWSAAPPGR